MSGRRVQELGARFFLWMTHRPPSPISLVYGGGRLQGRIVGLTGSNGKTTTKNLVRDVLACAGSVTATRGNQNNELGVPNTLLAADADTLNVVVEMGMRGSGQIDSLCSFVRPDWGIVTQVARATSSCWVVVRISRAPNPSSSPRFPKAVLLF